MSDLPSPSAHHPRMDRRRFLLTSLAGVLAAPLAVEGQQQGKVYRMGVLERTSPALNAANFDAFRQGLQELGYVEGKNFVIEYRSAEGRPERFPNLAIELVSLRVDLILTRGTPAALAAKKATGTIPVVMAAIGDPVETGVVTSLARPGGNVTGLSAVVIDLMRKRLELLTQVVPAISRIAAILDMSNPLSVRGWDELEIAAPRLGVQLQLLDVRTLEDLGRAFDAGVRQHVEAVVVGIDDLTQMYRRVIVDLAAKHRVPAIYASREFADAGGLISYGVNYPDLYRRAAAFVDRIFKGARPGDLPVEQPTKFELVINLKTAKALGLTIPPSLLARADQVIE
jgi:putative tryptophan/tyrosine transport system substrate-binding protein